MSKSILSMLGVALVCAAAASARADQGITSSTLDEMGLSGLTVMTDADAQSVRGMGYTGSKKSHHAKKAKLKSSAKASGRSWAEIEFEGEKLDVDAEAGTHNKYEAIGNHEASGDNFSEAGMVKSWSTRVDYSDGTHSISTETLSISVSAGGFSSAKAH